MSQINDKKTAITIWVDESTEIKINKQEYNLVGYLITNSDTEEFSFLNKLKQARKEKPCCWKTLHGCEITKSDINKTELIKRWLKIFQEDESVYFHAFLYKKNESFITQEKTYEHYFAKQSVFSLANKMKSTGLPIQRMFSNVGTLTVLFDRRRAHSASVVKKTQGGSLIERLNELEDIYSDEIKEQIKNISGKDSKEKDFTVRFSFLSSECFDGMQFTDCFLYLIRNKLENKKNIFVEIFDTIFLSGLDQHTLNLGFEKIYEYDQKFNFFKSNK